MRWYYLILDEPVQPTVPLSAAVSNVAPHFDFLPSESDKSRLPDELPRSQLLFGPFRNSRIPVGPGEPERITNPKQKGLPCVNCGITWTEYVKTCTVQLTVSQRRRASQVGASHDGPRSLKDEWVCLSNVCASGTHPCLSCPICSASSDFAGRRKHRCSAMIELGIPEVLLTPAYMNREAVPCPHCKVVYNGRCLCRCTLYFTVLRFIVIDFRDVCNSCCSAKAFDSTISVDERKNRSDAHRRRENERDRKLRTSSGVRQLFPAGLPSPVEHAVRGILANNPQVLRMMPPVALRQMGVNESALDELIPVGLSSYSGIRATTGETVLSSPLTESSVHELNDSRRYRHSLSRVAARTGGAIT